MYYLQQGRQQQNLRYGTTHEEAPSPKFVLSLNIYYLATR